MQTKPMSSCFRFYGNDKKALFKEANIKTLTMRSRSNDSVVSDTSFSDALPSLSTAPGEPTGTSLPIDGTEKPLTYECGICLTSEQLSGDQNFHLVCGHKFCTDCWKEYLSHSILKEGQQSYRRKNYKSPSPGYTYDMELCSSSHVIAELNSNRPGSKHILRCFWL